MDSRGSFSERDGVGVVAARHRNPDVGVGADRFARFIVFDTALLTAEYRPRRIRFYLASSVAHLAAFAPIGFTPAAVPTLPHPSHSFHRNQRVAAGSAAVMFPHLICLNGLL